MSACGLWSVPGDRNACCTGCVHNALVAGDCCILVRGQFQLTCNTIPAHALQEFAYTMAAAYRSEQRRLLSFLRMADFMMCDTLQTVLVESVSEMLVTLEPTTYGSASEDQGSMSGSTPRTSASGAASAFSSSSGGRSLHAMASMINSSRRQRAAAAIAGMPLGPVTASQQAAAQTEAAEVAPAAADCAGQDQKSPARIPILEMDVVMTKACDQLGFVPEPEHFQVCGSSCRGLMQPQHAFQSCVLVSIHDY